MAELGSRLAGSLCLKELIPEFSPATFIIHISFVFGGRPRKPTER